MTSPIHSRNRFGFSSGSTPSSSPTSFMASGRNPSRYTPSPTKLESPRNVGPLNNNVVVENGNVNMTPKSSHVTDKNIMLNPDKVSDLALVAKSAYLVFKSDYSEDLMSRSELKQLLQIGGHNPTEDECERHWGHRTKMTYVEFERLFESLGPPPTEDQLVQIFKKLDPTGQGFIRRDVFFEALTSYGDQMSKDQLSDILKLNNQDFHSDPYFDYRSFCQNVKNTSQNLIALAREVANVEGQNFAVNSKTYRVRKKSASPQKTAATWENHCSTLKGAFYFEGDNLISHQYTMKVSQQGKYQISVHSAAGFCIDCQLFIFKVSESGTGYGSGQSNRNPESRFTFLERTPLVFPKRRRKDDEQILQNSSSWSGVLDKGIYLIVPSTTGCKLRKRTSQPQSDVELVTIDEQPSPGKRKVRLSDKFRRALTEIFYQVDLDSNGTLSREEFNLFNWRTSGEEVQGDEWKVVQENFSMENGELTLDGFLQLHQMEADDNGGDSVELWVTLSSMGYNHALVQDEVAMFEVSVYSEPGIEPATLSVSGLKSGGPLLDKATIRCIMDGAKQPKIIEAGKEILLYREDSQNLTSFVLQNRSSTTVTLSMDFSRSSNSLINHPHLQFSTTLSARSTLFVAQLIPDNPDQDFKPDLSVSLIR